jgi:hypothetical protein
VVARVSKLDTGSRLLFLILSTLTLRTMCPDLLTYSSVRIIPSCSDVLSEHARSRSRGREVNVRQRSECRAPARPSFTAFGFGAGLAESSASASVRPLLSHRSQTSLVTPTQQSAKNSGRQPARGLSALFLAVAHRNYSKPSVW